ncbi:hypothetical protein BBJ28_00008429 [Nothophytophthora sp. Chile5]|nr:hypothetical protein BBJ28_00008429 [Nothophytophthora sp. Chile5]
MESWQRYPGTQSAPQAAEEAPDRRGASSSAGVRASAPRLAVDEEKRAANDLATDQYPNGMQQVPHQQQPYYPTTNFEELPPSRNQQGYAYGQQVDPYTPQGYAGYPSTRMTPGYLPPQQRQQQQQQAYRFPTQDSPYEDLWTHQGPRQIQQPMPVRGEWVPLNDRRSGHQNGGWMRGHGGGGNGGGMRPPCPPGRRGRWGNGGALTSSRQDRPSFVVATLRLCIFHTLNALLGLVASAVLSAGICAAATLLPVCCIGLLIFRVLVFIVLALAQWDITLGNYVAPAHQCAYTHLPPYGLVVGDGGLSGYRLSPNLAFFSPLSLMAMLYFVVVKPVIGCLSLLAVMLVVSPVASIVASLTSHYHGYRPLEAFDVDIMSFSRYPGLSLVGAICVTLLGIALMQLVSKISLQATRFFCCEKFSVTSRFAGPPSMPYQYQHQYQPIAQNGATSYGAVGMER